VRAVDDESFEREVLQSGQPVVVDFWAPGCGPCKHVDEVLEELEREHAGVSFLKLDIDASPRAAMRCGVLSVPTAILFDGGEARSEVIGAHKRKRYEKAWAGWLR
jgi:thioredoxin 1